MKDLTVKQETELEAVNVESLDAWGDHDGGAQELIISKVLIMQSTSELVQAGEATMGEFRDSQSGEKYGDLKQPDSIIPFHFERVWVISSKPVGEDRYKFEGYEPINRSNENLPWTYKENGVDMKREYTRNFYCLLPDDMSMPVIVSFKGTSAKAGKNLWTQMYLKNKNMGKIPAEFQIELSAKRETKDKNTFCVMEIKKGKQASAEQKQQAFEWLKTIKSTKVKVHEPDADSFAKEDVEY